MKNTARFISFFILGSLFTGCTSDDSRSYIANSVNECNKIAFTCPQGQSVFHGPSGCGCEETEKPDDPDNRRLDVLIRNFLPDKVISKEHEDGFLAADFFNLAAQEDEEGNIKYEIYAIAKEYFVEDGKLLIGNAKNAIVSMDIEQTGTHYIIRNYRVFYEDNGGFNNEAVKRDFSQEAYDWIFNQEGEQRSAIARISDSADFYGQTHFGMVLESFTGSEETSTDNTSEEHSA